MAKISFRRIKLGNNNKALLARINGIISEYQAAGYKLTLRQLYYQLVSRDVIPNKVTEYQKLSKILTEGRMAGVVDWSAIVDRLRVPSKPSSWNTPSDIMNSVIYSYQKPRMEGQDNYVEVWVEKDALSDVLKRVTEPYHIPLMVNRGYSSVSAIYDSYNRFASALLRGQTVTILYLGDFDPSGKDMIRDVKDRPLEMLMSQSSRFHDAYDDWQRKYDEEHGDGEAMDMLHNEYHDRYDHSDCFDEEGDFDYTKAWIKSQFEVRSIALTIEQIRQYAPPPNPAKVTDPRAKDYIAKYGTKSWELDALRPEVLNQILTTAVLTLIDLDKYNEIIKQERIDLVKLRKVQASVDDIKLTKKDFELYGGEDFEREEEEDDDN